MDVEARFSQNVEDYLSRRGQLDADLNYYEVMELDSTCSNDDVRHSYHHFARIFHPDKCGSNEYSFLLEEIKAAYEILSNDYKRVLYDIVNGHYEGENASEKLGSIHDVMREKYFAFVRDKAEAYLNSVFREYSQQGGRSPTSGLVIKRALYGDLSLRSPHDLKPLATVDAKQLRGPFIDVTIQLQLMIQNGVLHLNSGNSFAYLPGFYNPVHFENEDFEESKSHLYILYLFKNSVHEVTINDKCCLCLPMKSHLVFGNYIRGPYPLINLSLTAS